MLTSPLPTVEVDPPGTPQAVVIWLHGLGADGHDFEPIVPQLGLPPELSVRFVFPHAPEIPVTVFGGQVARAWFDFKAGGSIDEAGLKKSALRVRDLIQTEIDNGVAPERIVLAGFSQGGVLAFRTGLFYPRRLAGMLALSTLLADADELGSARTRANARTPILMCHGRHDEVLPMSLGSAAHQALQAAGYPVEWCEYPIGHEVSPPEIQKISQWLQAVLG